MRLSGASVRRSVNWVSERVVERSDDRAHQLDDRSIASPKESQKGATTGRIKLMVGRSGQQKSRRKLRRPSAST